MPAPTSTESEPPSSSAPVVNIAADAEGDGEHEEQDAIKDRDRIRVLTGATETAASFQFDNEDHTLGNALRYIIMKNPDVEFCGYSIPHPSEARMNLRIQTYDGVNVYAVLEKGLRDLEDLCDVVVEKFQEAKGDFVAGREGVQQQ